MGDGVKDGYGKQDGSRKLEDLRTGQGGIASRGVVLVSGFGFMGLLIMSCI